MLPLKTFFRELFLFGILPSIVVLYGIVPQKARRWVLLLSSYGVFWAFSGKLVLYLMFSTLSIHHFGLWISNLQNHEQAMLHGLTKEEKKAVKKESKNKQYAVIFLAVLIHIGILLVLKYSAFFATNINSLLNVMGVGFTFKIPKYILPIGISFYSLQAVSYIVDVYRKKISADNNLFRLALFMSFFPQIMEGPICRYSETADLLWSVPKLRYDNVIFGIQRITLGIFKKLIIADRVNMFVQNVFNKYAEYNGCIIVIGAAVYTLQLYAEFSGTMDLVIGTGQIFGITLPENFKRPFFSASISEFWKRWHITLGAWFKDYIFYPLSMSGPLKKLTVQSRKKLGNHFGPLISGAIALFCVWFCNGLWHGSAWNYIFFGMYHFTLILLGNIFDPYFGKLALFLHINRQSLPYKCFQIIRTTILVCIGELFFRSHGLRAGLAMFKKMFTDFSFEVMTSEAIYKIGMDIYDFAIIVFSVGVLFVLGILQESGISIREKIANKNVVIRFAVYYAVIIFIVIFGAYGTNYLPVDPMYANF